MVGTPGARRPQENTPLAQDRDKPPLVRNPSVIQQVTNFIGIGSRSIDGATQDEEKAKWEKKRLRRIANRYTLKDEAVQELVRNTSIHQSIDYQSGFPASLLTPGSADDVERGPGPSRKLGPTPSLPNYESTSFESGRQRADSFSQTADGSASQTRLSRLSSQRESVPTAVMSSVSNFFKKGSFINKKRMNMQTSFASKCSFDMDVVGPETPDDTTSPASAAGSDDATSNKESSSPAGIFMKAGGEAIEMKPYPRRTPPEVGLMKSEIPEETSFEVELEEMGEEDDAEMASDPSAISRMTARVRKKSSIRVPPQSRDLSELSSLTTKSAPPPLQRGKSVAPERPSDLTQGTRPFIHPSASLPSRVSSRAKKSRQEDQVLELLAEESEQKDRDEGKEPSTSTSQSFRPRFRKPTLLAERTISLVDEVFFDTPDRRLQSPELQGPAGAPPPELDAYHPDIAQSPPTSAKLRPVSDMSTYTYTFDPSSITVADSPLGDLTGVVTYHQEGNISYIDLGDSTLNRPRPMALGITVPAKSKRPDRPIAEMSEPSTSTRRLLIRQPTVAPEDHPEIRGLMEKQKKMQAVTNKFTQKIAQKPRKTHQRGIGVLGKILGRTYRKDLTAEQKRVLFDGTDEFPWFTYWVTTVQTVVCILSLFMYEIGPFGFDMRTLKDDVMDTTLSNRRVSYMEPENMWLGPHYSDLILMGALYSPCMRSERALWTVIEEERKIENRTGCCIANDHSGCYQSSESICPRNVARWVRWDKPDPIAAKRNFLTHKSKSDTDLLRNVSMLPAKWRQQRRSGAVCGQDPSYCDIPSSVAPYEWPDDITKWPICEKKHEGAGLPEHVTCPVTGRPCCIQLQGLCRIATKEYCDFVRGHWHENATLCSQVNCFSDVCGMLPFFSDSPNQFYRLFFSLFVHAGLFHLAVTIALQWWLMKDLEQLIGSVRMAILYIASGVGGNLASAIFVPYNPEVGPSGSQCGILAATMVELLHHRHEIKDFPTAIYQQLLLTGVVMLIGLVPWIDNWAHLFGLIFGLLTTIIIFPYIDFPPPVKPSATVPTTPRALPSAETPVGYRQLMDNGFPSPINEPGNTMFQPVRMVWNFSLRRFKNRRKFYVLLAFISAVSIFTMLAVIFFANIEIDCPWCIYFNCVPIFPCHNQGQKLKRWLPI